jgi:hypothetical protein
VQKLQNTLTSSEYPKLRRDSVFMRAVKLKVDSSQRRKKAKVETFGILGILPSLGRTRKILGGITASVGWVERNWTVRFSYV